MEREYKKIYEIEWRRYKDEHKKSIDSLNWFYKTDYKVLPDEELIKTFNWIYIPAEDGDNMSWFTRKYWYRNVPDDWFIINKK